MAETADSLVQWATQNQHLKDTPEFKAKAEQFKQLIGEGGNPEEPLPTVVVTPNEPPPAPAAPPAAATAPDATAPTEAPAGPPGDPNSTYNTAARVGVGALTGIPDLIIAGLNAGSRAGFMPPTKVPYLGPKVLSMLGAQEMAPDASLPRQLLEGGASALLGGGGTAALKAGMAAKTAGSAILDIMRSLATKTAVPTVTGHYGSEVGANVAHTFGLDPETGALIGGVLGAHGASASAEMPSRYIDWKYRGMNNPDAAATAQAARNIGVELPASALGNDTVRMRENSNANRWGASNFTQNRRMNAIDQTGAAYNTMADARGSLNPTPSSGEIGSALGEAARQGANELKARVSAPQESLMQRVGPNTPIDWQPILDRMRRLSAETDATTAVPIDTRINRTESRFPRDPVTGDITDTSGTYNQVKDFRTNVRNAGEGYDPVPSRYAGSTEDAATAVMRDAAIRRGVSPAEFDRTQERYAAAMDQGTEQNPVGGPHKQLTELTADIKNNPTAGTNYLRQGEQDPTRLRMLEATVATPRTPQQPINSLDNIIGDYIRHIGNQTINNPNRGAAAPRQLATRIEGMSSESRPILFGGQEQRALDIATVARALNAPTRQGGLGQTMGAINRDIPVTMGAGEIGHAVGSATGIPGAPTAGRTLGYLLGPFRRMLGGRMMQSPTALNALEGRPYQSNYSISDLRAAMNAASSPQTQGMPVGPRQ
jgi:hypothetical protein